MTVNDPRTETGILATPSNDLSVLVPGVGVQTLKSQSEPATLRLLVRKGHADLSSRSVDKGALVHKIDAINRTHIDKYLVILVRQAELAVASSA